MELLAGMVSWGKGGYTAVFRAIRHMSLLEATNLKASWGHPSICVPTGLPGPVDASFRALL